MSASAASERLLQILSVVTTLVARCFVRMNRDRIRDRYLENTIFLGQSLIREMKRLIAIASCLFVILAGAASAWASCEKVTFVKPDSQSHAHGEHAGSHHSHEKGTVIHCPTLDGFLLTAKFSASRMDRPERSKLAAINEPGTELGIRAVYPSLHGPPGYSFFTHTPSYLLFSVLRI